MPATATPRLLTSDDLEPYIALRREMLLDSPWAYGSAPGEDSGSDPSMLAKRLTMAHNAILVIDHPAAPGRLIAAAGVVRSHRVKTCHHAIIWGVYVQPDHRGKGHGRAIVRAAMDIASEWPGVAVIDIAVSSNSPEALKLYESLGFERWGTEPDAVRVDSQSFDDIHMCLRVEPGATASDQRESAVRVGRTSP